LSTTYAQKGPGELYSSFDYTRCGNPTRSALEEQLAALEYAQYAITFSSGCAALSSIMNIIEYGGHVICCDDVYGGT